MASCSCRLTPHGVSPSAHLGDGCADLILVSGGSRFRILSYLYRTSCTGDSVSAFRGWGGEREKGEGGVWLLSFFCFFFVCVSCSDSGSVWFLSSFLFSFYFSFSSLFFLLNSSLFSSILFSLSSLFTHFFSFLSHLFSFFSHLFSLLISFLSLLSACLWLSRACYSVPAVAVSLDLFIVVCIYITVSFVSRSMYLTPSPIIS